MNGRIFLAGVENAVMGICAFGKTHVAELTHPQECNNFLTDRYRVRFELSL